MKIYTKTGDNGTTGLFAGPRVSKDDARIVAYGNIDELNSLMGVAVAALPASLAASQLGEDTLSAICLAIQSDLLAIGAELATPQPDAQGTRLLSQHRVDALEKLMDLAELELAPLKSFILPGGCLSAAYLHYSRTVCRRAERCTVTLMAQPNVADYSRVLVYLNRLSDFLFVAARLANHRSGQPDVVWNKPAC